MIRVLLLWLVLAAPAMATTDAYPALYDVVGVASDDVLNIRSGPGTEYPVIGTLAPDAEGIEVIAPSADVSWAKINVGEETGWVSLTFVVPQPGQLNGSFPKVRHCFGTEPFWSLNYAPPGISLSSLGNPSMDGVISSLFTSKGRRYRFAYTGSFFPTANGDRDIHLSVRREICSDGMSDREYGIAVDMLITRPTSRGNNDGTGLYSGCCSLIPQSAE